MYPNLARYNKSMIDKGQLEFLIPINNPIDYIGDYDLISEDIVKIELSNNDVPLQEYGKLVKKNRIMKYGNLNLIFTFQNFWKYQHIQYLEFLLKN